MKKVIFFASIFISSLSFGRDNPSRFVEGQFVKLAHGDYMHLILRDDKDHEISFVCADLPKSQVKGIDCNDLEAKPLEFKNKILKVTFHEETNFIPEAQEKITWNYVDRVDLKK